MIASSTVKATTKKEPSGAEKKRAKLRREYIANVAMTTPEDPEMEIQREECNFRPFRIFFGLFIYFL